MTSPFEKPTRLPFLDSEPWPPEPKTVIVDVKEPVNQSKLAESLNRNPLKSIAVEVVSLTFGEMIEFVNDILSAKGEYQLPDRLVLATILHTAASNRLNNANEVVKSTDVEVNKNKPKNGRAKVCDDPKADQSTPNETLPVTGK